MEPHPPVAFLTSDLRLCSGHAMLKGMKGYQLTPSDLEFIRTMQEDKLIRKLQVCPLSPAPSSLSVLMRHLSSGRPGGGQEPAEGGDGGGGEDHRPQGAGAGRTGQGGRGREGRTIPREG